MKIDIVDDHQIDKAVAVVVAECGARGPAPVGNAGLCGHVGKRAIAIIAIENVAAQTGDVEIGPAVVVVIADRSAHGEAGRSQAGFCGDIGKRAVVIVVVERARALFAPLSARSTVGALVK